MILARASPAPAAGFERRRATTSRLISSLLFSLSWRKTLAPPRRRGLVPAPSPRRHVFVPRCALRAGRRCCCFFFLVSTFCVPRCSPRAARRGRRRPRRRRRRPSSPAGGTRNDVAHQALVASPRGSNGRIWRRRRRRPSSPPLSRPCVRCGARRPRPSSPPSLPSSRPAGAGSAGMELVGLFRRQVCEKGVVRVRATGEGHEAKEGRRRTTARFFARSRGGGREKEGTRGDGRREWRASRTRASARRGRALGTTPPPPREAVSVRDRAASSRTASRSNGRAHLLRQSRGVPFRYLLLELVLPLLVLTHAAAGVCRPRSKVNRGFQIIERVNFDSSSLARFPLDRSLRGTRKADGGDAVMAGGRP